LSYIANGLKTIARSRKDMERQCSVECAKTDCKKSLGTSTLLNLCVQNQIWGLLSAWLKCYVTFSYATGLQFEL